MPPLWTHPRLSHRVHQVEERSKLNRQGSPKICTTVSDTAIQSRSDSISQSGVVHSAQTPPMQRPVEPQGGQGKVGTDKRGSCLETPSLLLLCLRCLLPPSTFSDQLLYLLIKTLSCFFPPPLPSLSSHLTPLPGSFLISTSYRAFPRAGVRPTLLQFQMAHLVPLKPYAAPVPRSQSLCDQPTKTMSAFPTQDPSLTPTPRPIHSRELVRQNSDPTSETPAPQTHQVREDPGPWIRLPDVELPPKVGNGVELQSLGCRSVSATLLNLRRGVLAGSLTAGWNSEKRKIISLGLVSFDHS